MAMHCSFLHPVDLKGLRNSKRIQMRFKWTIYYRVGDDRCEVKHTYICLSTHIRIEIMDV